MKISIIRLCDLHFRYTGNISDFNGLDTAIITNELPVSFIASNHHDLRIFHEFIIPKGFETDFGTVPKLLQWLVKPRGTSDRAYVVHDWLCVTKIIDQKIADKLLFTIMRKDNTKLCEASIAYIGVRLYNIFVRPFRKKTIKLLPHNIGLIGKRK